MNTTQINSLEIEIKRKRRYVQEVVDESMKELKFSIGEYMYNIVKGIHDAKVEHETNKIEIRQRLEIYHERLDVENKKYDDMISKQNKLDFILIQSTINLGQWISSCRSKNKWVFFL